MVTFTEEILNGKRHFLCSASLYLILFEGFATEGPFAFVILDSTDILPSNARVTNAVFCKKRNDN